MVEGGGFGNCGIFLAHNYVSEQFGNYVEYGMYFLPCVHFDTDCVERYVFGARFSSHGKQHLQTEM